MLDFLGFQFMVILNLYGIPFYAVVVLGLCRIFCLNLPQHTVQRSISYSEDAQSPSKLEKSMNGLLSSTNQVQVQTSQQKKPLKFFLLRIPIGIIHLRILNNSKIEWDQMKPTICSCCPWRFNYFWNWSFRRKFI